MKTIDPGISAEKSFKGVYGRRTDDGWQMIIIAHPEPSAQMR